VLKYLPALEKIFLASKCPVRGSWRMDETYVRIKGAWKYLYHAIDKSGPNTAAIVNYNAGHDTDVEIRRSSISTTSLNGIIGRSSEWSERCWGLRHSGRRR
jgi:hypothetical protein